MPVETAALFVSQLNPSWPLLSDTVYSEQAHIVLLKQVLQSQFPNLGAAPLTGTAAALNLASGAFSGAVLTVPATTTVNASLVLQAISTAASTTLQAGSGLTVTSQGPAVAGATPPAVTELRTDGAGNLTVAQRVTATTLTIHGAAQVDNTLNCSQLLQVGSPLIPTGMIMMWYGSVASVPAGWYLCNGLNGTPNLTDRFVIGAGNSYAPGATGGYTYAILNVANLPSHTHAISDPGHTHGIYDPGHNHGILDPGHAHGISDPGHSHSYNQASLPYGSIINSGSGATVTNTPTATSASTTGITISNHMTGLTLSAALSGIVNYGAATGISAGYTGSGTAFATIPPYYALCYVMKS